MRILWDLLIVLGFILSVIGIILLIVCAVARKKDWFAVLMMFVIGPVVCIVGGWSSFDYPFSDSLLFLSAIWLFEGIIFLVVRAIARNPLSRKKLAIISSIYIVFAIFSISISLKTEDTTETSVIPLFEDTIEAPVVPMEDCMSHLRSLMLIKNFDMELTYLKEPNVIYGRYFGEYGTLTTFYLWEMALRIKVGLGGSEDLKIWNELKSDFMSLAKSLQDSVDKMGHSDVTVELTVRDGDILLIWVTGQDVLYDYALDSD